MTSTAQHTNHVTPLPEMRGAGGEAIALLLSGGVDSAVALHLLCEQGVNPDCFYIKIGPEEEEEWDCSSEEDMEMCSALCRRYGCKLEVVDCHKEYWNQVTRYTMEKVKNGFTPNPDIMCNRLIKFGAFNEKRGHDYDTIATGHYAQTELETLKPSEPLKPSETLEPQTRKWLCTAPDPVKDQTDFLSQIYGWQLEKAMFPIGHLWKHEVREIAENEHLVNARRKDSQGICFLGKINYNDYIRRYLGENPGDVVELETGRKIGQHKGLWFHTIGQRKGLGFSGGPWFVIKKDIKNNILYVSNGYNPEDAYKKEFCIHDMNLLAPEMPTGECYIKIRHVPEFNKAFIAEVGDGVWSVKCEEAIHGVAPGQFCTIYDNNHHRCYGSAEITL